MNLEELSVEELEDHLYDTAQTLYERAERRIEPTYPWVLVRTVPKEQTVGGIYLADVGSGLTAQHKPLAEGIVLATWAPFLDHLHPISEGGAKYIRERKSDFEPGDRVLYPHFAGLPVSFLDETKYRVIREWTFDPNGGAMCKVHFDGDRRFKPILDELFADLHSVTMSGN